jgi:hypothetical protein
MQTKIIYNNATDVYSHSIESSTNNNNVNFEQYAVTSICYGFLGAITGATIGMASYNNMASYNTQYLELESYNIAVVNNNNYYIATEYKYSNSKKQDIAIAIGIAVGSITGILLNSIYLALHKRYCAVSVNNIEVTDV